MNKDMQTNKNQGAAAGDPAAPVNMRLYERLRCVPSEAKKPIEDGRLKGSTNINTMWRLKHLTEVFGPCGFGWRYEIVNKYTQAASDTDVSAFVDVNLYVKDPESGEWSAAIPGTGGNVYTRVERSGKLFVNDEAFKMALSDAISVAGKAIGLGADVYFEEDRSKYDLPQGTAAAGTAPQRRQRTPAERRPLTPQCGYWLQSVAIASSTTDDIPAIRRRIEKIYTISDQDFDLLMEQAGRKKSA